MNKTSLKYLPLHIGYILLAVLAVLFFKERLYADSGWFFFKVVNTSTFRIENNRIILALSQLLPFLGVKLGLPLKLVTILYSLNHVIFPWFISTLALHLFRDTRVAYALLLSQVVGISVAYFTPMYELYYVISLLFLWYLLMRSDKYWLQLLGIFPLVFIISGHTLAVPLLAITVWQLYVIHKKELSAALWLNIAVAIAGIAYMQANVSAYDQSKIQGFLTNLHEATYDITYVVGLMKYLIRYHWDALILLVLLAFIPLKISKFHRLIFVAASFILIILFNLTEYGFNHNRYHEQVYVPLTYALVFPLAINIQFRSKHIQSIVLILIATIFISRITVIVNSRYMNTGRVVELETLIQRAKKQGQAKIVVNQEKLKHPTNWSYPAESLILSSLSKDSSVSIITEADYLYDKNMDRLKKDDYVARRWEIGPLSSLNVNYFKLKPQQYKLLTKYKD